MPDASCYGVEQVVLEGKVKYFILIDDIPSLALAVVPGRARLGRDCNLLTTRLPTTPRCQESARRRQERSRKEKNKRKGAWQPANRAPTRRIDPRTQPPQSLNGKMEKYYCLRLLLRLLVAGKEQGTLKSKPKYIQQNVKCKMWKKRK